MQRLGRCNRMMLACDCSSAQVVQNGGLGGPRLQGLGCSCSRAELRVVGRFPIPPGVTDPPARGLYSVLGTCMIASDWAVPSGALELLRHPRPRSSREWSIRFTSRVLSSEGRRVPPWPAWREFACFGCPDPEVGPAAPRGKTQEGQANPTTDKNETPAEAMI